MQSKKIQAQLKELRYGKKDLIFKVSSTLKSGLLERNSTAELRKYFRPPCEDGSITGDTPINLVSNYKIPSGSFGCLEARWWVAPLVIVWKSLVTTRWDIFLWLKHITMRRHIVDV